MSNSAKEIKLDMTNKIKASHGDLMDCLGAFDKRIIKVEELTSSVSSLVQTANSNVSENSDELVKIGVKVDLNRDNILTN